MANLSTNSKNQRLTWILVSASIALILLVGLYLLYIAFTEDNSKNHKTISQNTALIQNAPNINDFLKGFTGTRETLDGSIEAVLLDIKSIDTTNKSFEFTLNIGLSQKINGFGTINLDKKVLNADVIGELVFTIDSLNRIYLNSSPNSNSNKFNLIEELK